MLSNNNKRQYGQFSGFTDSVIMRLTSRSYAQQAVDHVEYMISPNQQHAAHSEHLADVVQRARVFERERESERRRLEKDMEDGAIKFVG